MKSPINLKGRNFLSMADLTRNELSEVLDLAVRMKADRWGFENVLKRKVVTFMSEKESLRTGASFEIGIGQLGGIAFVPVSSSVKMGEISKGAREEVKDVARTIGRYVDLIVARVYEHDTLRKLAEHSGKPVINALSDLEHPCQAVGDFLTIRERFGDFDGLNLVFMGDGNNVCHSLMLGAAILGVKMTVCCPGGYMPKADIIRKARELNGEIEIVHDPATIEGAHIIYTDVWASMGQKEEANAREGIFRPYQIDSGLMSRQHKEAIFMHCLPAERGREVTDEVIESPQSVVFDQAENRLHVQKALMSLIMNPEAITA